MSSSGSIRSKLIKLRPIWLCVGLLSLALPTSGCATIVSSSKQEVTLTSRPASADITITTDSGGPVWAGKTPAVVELARKQPYIITASVPGYVPAKARIDTELNGWFCGNILCGGLVGFIVDYATGAMWQFDNDSVAIDLVAAPGSEGDTASETMVLLFRAKDDRGELRELALPLIPEPGASGA